MATIKGGPKLWITSKNETLNNPAVIFNIIRKHGKKSCAAKMGSYDYVTAL